ncbi:MAG: type II toxin-antitoxin system RelE/ParE family toxin [Alphaproteobacteria bacterium]|nr:type II toxin-antitoxin system RelE/ParE family toxin [Alphaproteobacteria bacterium]
MKPIVFLGDSRKRLKDFPDAARIDAGRALERVQRGLEPYDWKPMKGIGRGVREIRVRERSGAYRVIYVASVGEAVFVLHAFQKKTQKTAALDLEVARLRYKLIGDEHES